MLRFFTIALATMCWFACGACSHDAPTQLIVVADTDLRVPQDADALIIQVIPPEGEAQTTTAPIVANGMRQLPLYVALTQDKGPVGPYTIHAIARKTGIEVLRRSARVSFVPNQARMLRLNVMRACAATSCGATQACDNGVCRALDISASELEPWTQVPGPLDASVPQLDGCVPAAEVCNGADDDCDLLIDEDFDLVSDNANCGRCGMTCTTGDVNGTSTCQNSECTFRCNDGYAMCSPGVQVCTRLGTTDNCASCGNVCSGTAQYCIVPSGSSTGTCGATCPAPLTTCPSGCTQTSFDPHNCGSCGTDCDAIDGVATGACLSGQCSIVACEPGRRDCTGAPGCETDITTATDCGACGNNCNTLPHVPAVACVSGHCGTPSMPCESGYADCNGDPGCETDIASVSNCGGCGNDCLSILGVTDAMCVSGHCVATACSTGLYNCDGDETCETDGNSPYTCGGCLGTGGVDCTTSCLTATCDGTSCDLSSCASSGDPDAGT